MSVQLTKTPPAAAEKKGARKKERRQPPPVSALPPFVEEKSLNATTKKRMLKRPGTKKTAHNPDIKLPARARAAAHWSECRSLDQARLWRQNPPDRPKRPARLAKPSMVAFPTGGRKRGEQPGSVVHLFRSDGFLAPAAADGGQRDIFLQRLTGWEGWPRLKPGARCVMFEVGMDRGGARAARQIRILGLRHHNAASLLGAAMRGVQPEIGTEGFWDAIGPGETCGSHVRQLSDISSSGLQKPAGEGKFGCGMKIWKPPCGRDRMAMLEADVTFKVSNTSSRTSRRRGKGALGRISQRRLRLRRRSSKIVI